MPRRPNLTEEDVKILKQLYKAHYTPKEVSSLFPFGYGTVIEYYRSFKYAGIEKYDRTLLIKFFSEEAA